MTLTMWKRILTAISTLALHVSPNYVSYLFYFNLFKCQMMAASWGKGLADQYSVLQASSYDRAIPTTRQVAVQPGNIRVNVRPQ